MPPESHEDVAEFIAQREAAQRHLAAVGSVAGTWATFEIILDGRTLWLAGMPDALAGLCLTAQIIGAARKLDAYIAVAKLRGAEKTAPKLEKFAKETAVLAEQRNRVVHDPWLFQTDQIPQRLEITARKKLRSMLVPVSTDDMEKLDKRIAEHITRFFKLNDEVLAEIGASPETQP